MSQRDLKKFLRQRGSHKLNPSVVYRLHIFHGEFLPYILQGFQSLQNGRLLQNAYVTLTPKPAMAAK